MFASGPLRLTLMILVPPLLASCANTVATQPGAPVSVVPPPVNAAPVAPAPRAQPRAQTAIAPSIPAIPPAPPAPPRDEAGVRAAFGEPRLVRKEAQSEMWRYDGVNCALFVFLYRENETILVRHMETLPKAANEAADETCVAGIRARKAS